MSDSRPVSAVQETKKVSGSTRDKAEPTPKRPTHKQARPPANPPKTYKEARERAKATRGPKPDKEAKRKLAAQRRTERMRISEGQDRGDPLYDKYHMPRDKGPERLLVRDIVDSRVSIGQYFFVVAILIMFLNNPAMPPVLQTASLIGWVAILLAFVIDSVFLCRKIKRIVWGRFPKTKQRKPGLYWYAISRSIMFKKLRMPRPRPSIDRRTQVEDLGKVVKG
ncbi:DUF3043 domain-containing protein [Stackebrandtia soli]|uniref:DUF3043 domain-containing protein n=1 Tax=Stackebrandtia soli TaxID=1892856 RepID=UPI0039E8E374